MKQVKDYTLGEVKEICKQRRETGGICTLECPFYCWCGERDDTPSYWKLKGCWPQKDIDEARAVKVLFPETNTITRTEANALYINDDYGERELPCDLFSGLERGSTVTLDEIINGND